MCNCNHRGTQGAARSGCACTRDNGRSISAAWQAYYGVCPCIQTMNRHSGCEQCCS